jgi:MipA family protein
MFHIAAMSRQVISMTFLSRILLALAVAVFTAAAGACVPDKEDCVELGKWDLSLGIGAGVRTNPLEGGDDIPLFLIPQVNYNGERFFIQNLDLGVVLFENETHNLNLFVTPSYDQIFFDPWKPSNFVVSSQPGVIFGPCRGDCTRKLRKRETAGLAGIEYGVLLDDLNIQLQYLTDVTDVHDGDEARLSLSKYWNFERLNVSAALGLIWQSEEIVNYYYGVTRPEADARGTYETDAGISYLLRSDWTYKLSKNWDLKFLATYKFLSDEINQSPLVEEKGVTTIFVGGVYHF